MRHTETGLSKIGAEVNTKNMWAAIRQLMNRQQTTAVIDGVTAESLCDHYATIFTDLSCTPPLHKLPAYHIESEYILDWQVFKIDDKLHPTASGLVGPAAWFLRLGAPDFCKPLKSDSSNLQSFSSHHNCSKQATIQPIPKAYLLYHHCNISYRMYGMLYYFLINEYARATCNKIIKQCLLSITG